MRLLRYLQPHSEALPAVLARITQGAAFALALPIVLWRMPTPEQGFLFSFLNLATLIQALDFGLTVVIIQSASHYQASGNSKDLAGFWHTAWRMALAALAAATIVVFIVGVTAFRSAERVYLEPVGWRLPWATFVLASAASQMTMILAAFIEGAVSPSVAWRFQKNMELISGVIFLIALAAGASLWSLPAFTLARACIGVLWLIPRRHLFPPWSRPYDLTWWRHNIWAFQWRIALNSFSYFFVFRAFNPIVLAEQGPITASRFGLSWSVMSMLITIYTAWPISQIARYSSLATRRCGSELRFQFRRMFLASTGLLILTAAGILLLLWYVALTAPSIAQRFAGLDTVALLLAAAVIHHIQVCFMPLLRSEGRDPFMTPNLISAVITLAVCWLVARHSDIRNVAAAYFAATLLPVPYYLLHYAAFAGRWNLKK